jgi:DNA-binding GntR family transcriptional regulator
MPGVAKLITFPDSSGTKPRSPRGAIQIYETLRADILWLRLEPGAAIDEVTLAKRFDVSRTPIREALMLLAGDGLVVFLPNRTTIVLPLSLHNLGEYLDMYLLLSRAVVRGAVLNDSADREIPLRAALAEVLLRLETAPGTKALEADLALRHLMGEMAKNMYQAKYHRETLDAGIRTKVLHLYPNSYTDDLRFMQDCWRKLIDAILHKDADAADRIVTQLILAEGKIILRPLAPRYGHTFDLNKTKPNETL